MLPAGEPEEDSPPSALSPQTAHTTAKAKGCECDSQGEAGGTSHLGPAPLGILQVTAPGTTPRPQLRALTPGRAWVLPGSLPQGLSLGFRL